MKRTKKLLIGILLALGTMCLIFAACGSKNVKISFETNGAPAVETMEVQKGDEFTLPHPEWEGHLFLGWYADADYAGSAVENGTADKDTTYYAKWETLGVITLQLGGGSLGGIEKLYLRVGENLLNFMQDQKPEKADHEFGEWLLDGAPLSAVAIMPAEGVTLTAHYKVAYTIETYKQNLARDGYERGEDLRGYAYAGEEYTPEPGLKGFGPVEHEGARMTLTLSENASENVYTFYFDREQYFILYMSLSDGSDGQDVRQSYYYGEEAEIAFDLFARQGYLFMGWATVQDGETVYQSDLDAMAFNGGSAGTPPAPTKVTVEEDLLLYAVWQKGYTDMFGGSDLLYLGGTEGVVYLWRAGRLFKGEIFAENEFLFTDDTKTIVEGKLNTDGTFTYRDSRRQRTVWMYRAGVGPDSDTTLMFDPYNGVTYSEKVGTQTSDSSGSYRFTTENGVNYYEVTFTTGALAGETDIILVEDITFNGTERSVFRMRGDEYAWGEMNRIAVDPSAGVTYYVSAYLLSLDGFGTATLSTDTSRSQYDYEIDGEKITLINSRGQTAGVCFHNVIGGRSLYAVYDETFDNTYTLKDGAELKLDGTFNAEYTNGATYQKGYFTCSEDTVFGGYVVTFLPSGTSSSSRLFVITSKTDTVTDAEGTQQSVTTYSVEEKPTNYAAYYYTDGEAVYYAPVVVFGDSLETADKITVYGYVSGTRTYEKVLLGSYAYDAATSTYLFTTETHYPFSEDVSTDLFDYTRLSAFTFGRDIYMASSLFGTSYYPVTYWHSVTLTDETGPQTTNYEKVYAQKDGDGSMKLTLVGAFAILSITDDGETVSAAGQYTLSDNILTLTPAGSSTAFRFEIDEENQEFILLQGLLGTTYGYDPTMGSRVPSETLVFDGKGGAVLTNGEDVTKGTYRLVNETSLSGSSVYEFLPEGSAEAAFRFIIASTSSYSVFARYDRATAGEYLFIAENGREEQLVLDGYGYYATYTDVSGNFIEGTYILPEPNVVYFTFQNYAIYFDLTTDEEGGKAFTIRGGEYGDYIVFDNNGPNGVYLRFNGYGKAVVYNIVEDDAAEGGVREEPIDEKARYVRNGAVFEIHYNDGVDDKTLYGVRGTVTLGYTTFPAFFVQHEEVVSSYVDPTDWSVLELDAYGFATLYLQNGAVQDGRYNLITEDLLYYVNVSDSSDACLYRYDRQKGTVQKVRYREDRGYYTTDLDSLLFSRSGFMVADGETSYYYDVADDGSVTLYHQDATAEHPNRYGFVSEPFAGFEAQIEFGGKTYYSADGWSIIFSRAADSADKYPLLSKDAEGNVTMTRKFTQLSFAPTGKEFYVQGTIAYEEIEGDQKSTRSVSCYVTREIVDGEPVMYVTVGSYRLDIGVSYVGGTDKNTWSIEALHASSSFYSSMYLQYYYLFLMFMGQGISNSFGVISFVTEYDENGEQVANYLEGTFGPDSNMYDTKGELVRVERGDYKQWAQNAYYVDFTGKDGVSYRLRVRLTNEFAQIFGVNSYDLVSFSRLDTVQSADGYEVEVERVVVSDMYESGQIIMATLKESGEEIEVSETYVYRDKLYFMVRTEDEDGNVTENGVCYIVTLKSETVGEEGGLPAYTSAEVEKLVIKTYTDADGVSADICEDKQQVVMLRFARGTMLAESTQYDAEANTYTVKTFSGATYTVTIAEDGTVTIAEVPEDPAA